MKINSLIIVQFCTYLANIILLFASTTPAHSLPVKGMKKCGFIKFFLPNQTNIVKENSEYFNNNPFVELNVSKLINYSTDMC